MTQKPKENTGQTELVRGNEKVTLVNDIRAELETVLTGNFVGKLKRDLGDTAEISDLAVDAEVFQGSRVITVDIRDREKFLKSEQLKKLIPHVGKLIWNVFEDRQNPEPFDLKSEEDTEEFIQNYFRDGDMGSADRMYLLEKDGEVQGLRFLKHRMLSNGQKSAHLLLAVLGPRAQGSGLFRELTHLLFKNEGADYFTGLTHTPQGVASFQKVAPKEGIELYYCNRKNADSTIPLTQGEAEMLRMLKEEDIDQQVKEYELTDMQAGLPSQYVTFGEASIKPRRMEELRMPEDSPLYQTMKELIEYQQKNRPGETIYGTLIMARKPKDQTPPESL